MANHIGLLFISFILFSKGIHFASAKECKYEHKYMCGIQDCNCRYVSQTGDSISSLYRRFKALFAQNNDDGKVCDKCEVFCSKEKHINCHNGACDKQKGCICRDCWSGETCLKYHNNLPEFKESFYVAEIKEDTNVGDEILKVSAIDPDMETCVDKHNCPCGRVKYFIDKGNENVMFFISPDSGVIRLSRKLSDADHYNPISLTIVAENEGDLNTVEDNQSGKALATVVISVKNDELKNGARERRSLHHRARRSVTNYNALEITFAPVTNKTFFDAGCTINYRLYLVQNSSASSKTLNNISIQISSKNLELGTSGYLVNISNVVKTPGSIVQIDSDTVNFTVTDSVNQSGYMEITFQGRVRKNLDPLALLQVVFTMNATASGSVTVGPKYSTEVYTTYPEIKFKRTTEGDVPVESTLNYNVNISLPYFNFTFILEITTVVNDFRFLSIEDAQLGDISNSVDAQYPNPTPTKYTGANDNITSRVVLNFGKILVFDTDQNANTIKLSFSVKVNDHHLLENASKHWVGLGAHSGEEMLWVGQDAIRFLKDEPYLFAEIKAVNSTNPTRYHINDVLTFSWSVKHANASYESAYNLTVLFYFSKSTKWLDNGAASGLANGNKATSFETGRGREVLTFTYTQNGGTLSKSEILSGIIALTVNNTVTSLADLNVEIQIRYQTSKSEDRPIRTYKPNPGYLAGVPSFNLTSNVANRVVNIGQLFEITVKILIKKITVEGKLYVILPVQNSSAIMRFIKHESFLNKFYGTNIQVTPTFTDAKPTFNSTTNVTTYYDRAETDLGLIKNKALTDSALSSIDDNTVTLSFKVVLEDNDYIRNQSCYKIGVGVKGSEHMVWISQMTFISNVVVNRRPRLLIEPYSNGSDNLIQGSIVQYNFTISHKDGSNAHAVNVEVVWMLPVYTKYLQINQKSHHEMSSVTSRNNIVFKLKKLDFGETPTASFSVALDPDKTINKSGKNYAVTPVALTYKNKQHNTYYEPLVPMSAHFKVPEKPTPVPSNAVKDFYKRGFLVDSSNSAIYICSLSSKRNKPSCFWTDTRGITWRAVDVMVISIIGIHNATKTVYGVGNNMMSYMKYIPNKAKWYSISQDQWEKAKSTLSDHEVVKIEDGDDDLAEPATDKQKNIGNGERWGATKTGVFHYSASEWKRKALWNSCH